jgi:type II secretory pathway pseudopilin PulG
LIEVTFSLAILGTVLLGSTAVAALAYRMGQTARERTTVSQQAQEQMEALRSFRDNATNWQDFQQGTGCGGGGYCGIVNVAKGPCHFDGSMRCFHMTETNKGGTPDRWVPASGSVSAPGGTGGDPALTVPTSTIEIALINPTTETPPQNANMGNCAYDVEIHYSFKPLGGGTDDKNQIVTRLANLSYNPEGGPSVCPNP